MTADCIPSVAPVMALCSHYPWSAPHTQDTQGHAERTNNTESRGGDKNIHSRGSQLTACVGSLLPTLELTGVKYNTQSGDNQVHNMNIRGKTSMLVPPEVS